jgi:NAD(P)H-dependent flavin oxidoreductase YrpB (nitropropane dioxygenase family)
MMKLILLFVPDLFFSTRIEDAAQRLGYAVETVGADADFEAAFAEKRPALVVLTFERTGQAWERLAEAAERAGVNVLAFGSHMNVEAFKRAKALGCEEVVANSRLSAELPNLLTRWAG